jgi:hypothetical protein
MTTRKKKTSFLRPVHFQAVVFIVVYFIISNAIFYGSVAHPNIFVSFFVPLVFGMLSSFAFLYLFSHEDFFHFIKKLDRAENRKENKFLEKFSQYGRILACILVAIIGGPIFLSLTVRFLFLESENRYMIIFIVVLISTLISVAIAKGLFSFII